MLQFVFIIRKEVASHSSPCCTYTAEDLYTHHTATQARAGSSPSIPSLPV